MARFPDSFIDQVRERADLLELVSRHVTLKKSGTNWMGPCPFHQDKDPSFSVRPDKGFYKCFGCGKSGDVFSFIMETKGSGFNEAVEELAAMTGLPLPSTGAEDPRIIRERAERQELHDLLGEVKRLYRSQLRGPAGRHALAYLRQRGLRDETIDRFALGYALPEWRALEGRFGSGDAARKLLLKAGLLVEREGKQPYDRFRNRIMFPIHDVKGRVVGFGARLLGGEGPKYLNSPETAVYHKGEMLYGLDRALEPIQRAGQVLVVEGYMDAIALANHGISEVVATLGTALTPKQVSLLWRRTRRVTFCFDGDAAGQKAAWRALEQVLTGLEADRHVGFLFLPNGEDPDDAVRREGPEAFRQRLTRALSPLAFLHRWLGRELDLESPEGRAALVHRARPYLERVADPVLRDLYAEELEKQLGLSRGQVREQMAPAAPELNRAPLPAPGERRAPWRPTPPRPAPATPPLPRVDLARGVNFERALLVQVLQHPRLAREHDEELGRLTLDDPLLGGLLESLLDQLHQVAEGPADAPPQWEWPRLQREGRVELVRTLLAEGAASAGQIDDGQRHGAFKGCLLACQERHVSRDIRTLTSRHGNSGWDAAALQELRALKLEQARLQAARRNPGCP